MSIKYHLAEDTIDNKDIDALVEWLKTYPRLTQGPLVREFEEKWSGWLGMKYSVACNSGSSANMLMYAALDTSGWLTNRKVIVPSVGWPTTITPAIQLGFAPIMCEADKDTFGLDLNHLEDLLKKHKPGIVTMVQVLGIPHKMDELMALKERYGFFLLEDNCAAMGSSYKGRHLGTFGDMSSISLYFGHQISTIEGGMVSTNDSELYNHLLMVRSHGWLKDVEEDFRREKLDFYGVDDFSKPFFFVVPGFNFRMTDLQAFIGIRQIDKMDWLIRRRMENHLLYRKILGERFYVQNYNPDDVVCTIHFGMLAASGEERKQIVTALEANGIETRMFSAGNLGRHPFWSEEFGEFSAPIADKIHDCGLFLPNHPSLNPEDINFIASVVLDSVSK